MPHKIDPKFRLVVTGCLALSLLSALAWLAPEAAPTAALAQTGSSLSVRQITLTTNSIAYNAARQELYATLPSNGAPGNSVVRINTTSGAVESPIFVGSEPMKMAFSDDGQTMYVSLFGRTPGVRRVDLRTQAAGLQFPMGLGGTEDDLPCYLAVMPDAPDTVAVAGLRGITAIYDNGVRRPQISFGAEAQLDGSALQFGVSPTRLYSGYTVGPRPIRKLKVGPEGASEIGIVPVGQEAATTYFDKSRGLLFTSGGDVIDPEVGTIVHTFSGLNTDSLMAVAPAEGRVYFLTGSSYSTTWNLIAYDMNTYMPVGSTLLPDIQGTPSDLVRWGDHGLAFRTFHYCCGIDWRVVLVETELVGKPQPVVTGVRLLSGSPTVRESDGTLVVDVVRTGDISSTTTVGYATSDYTAVAGSDYTAASGTLAFAPGETQKSFNVAIRQDDIYEGDETFAIALRSPAGGLMVEPASAFVTIHDDEPPPSISIGDVSVVEGNTNTSEAQLTVSLSPASEKAVSVNYATADGTASSASDYHAAFGTLVFPALTTSATFKVPVSGDFRLEPDETFTVNLSGPVNASLSRTQATVTILNDDAPGRFQFSAPSYSLSEDGGSATITVNRVDGLAEAVSISYATSDGTAVAGSDYTAASGTLTFSGGESAKAFFVPIRNDTRDEPDKTVTLTLSGPTAGASLGSPAVATLNITNDDRPLVQFGSAFYAAGEEDRQVILTVKRRGDPSAPLSVNYTTADGTAAEVSDYNLTLGTLRFAADETEKTLAVLVTDDALVEPDETFLVSLSAPSGGSLGTPATATVTLGSDDAAPGPNPVGDGFDARFFVRQHYHDFLNREPDAEGLQFWTEEITKCGADASCVEVKRINVSAAFFLSIEFQQTGFFVYRLHQAAYNTQERLRWRTFLADTQEVGRGVRVGVGDWQAQLESNKKALVERFATSPTFDAAYQSLSNAQYVEALAANTLDPLAPGLGGALTQAERDQLVTDLNQSKKTRAEVLRAVAENAEFARRQNNKAFVLMQYYGYLRRNPDSGPDADFSGYNFWLSKLNEFNGNFIQAEMVKAFTQSIEYRKRFGQ